MPRLSAHYARLSNQSLGDRICGLVAAACTCVHPQEPAAGEIELTRLGTLRGGALAGLLADGDRMVPKSGSEGVAGSLRTAGAPHFRQASRAAAARDSIG